MSILVMGVCGSGKSTVAAALASAMQLEFLEADAFHSPHALQKMAGGTPLTDEDRGPWLAAIAARLREAAASRRPCVLACSALKRGYRDVLRTGEPLLRVVCLSLPADAVAARLAARVGHFMHPGLLDSQLSILELPAPDERALLFSDARAAPAEVARAVAAWLPRSLHLRCPRGARFSVLRLPPSAPVPDFAAAPGGAAPPLLLSVTRTRCELSLVLPTEAVPAGFPAAAGAPPGADDGAQREDGWACLTLVPPGGEGTAIPFDMVGVLLAIAQPLAEAKVGIFALSTFNTDHVLVKAAQLDAAAAALRLAGHACELVDQ